MSGVVTRRRFVSLVPGLAALGLSGPARESGTTGQEADAPARWSGFPANDPELVREVVGVSHGNLAQVRELVERQPGLARASIDWGFGDTESCIEAASHTGQREIAELLLAHGARATLFTAAMLGQLDVVRACIAANPGVQRTYGPHGITLLAHARAGGPDAEPVVRYLVELGDADIPHASAPLAAADREAVLGRYAFGPGPRDYFDVDVQRDQLGIARPGGPARRGFTHTGGLVFFPAGVPTVKIAFGRENGRVRRLSIADPDVFLTARRTQA